MAQLYGDVNFSKVSHRLEQAAAELRNFLEKQEHESAKLQGGDVAMYTRSSRHQLRNLQTLVNDLRVKTKQFKDHISRNALNYGLNLIPDEVLANIFVFAAGSLFEKVVLSLVCRRFRTIMLSMRKMWSGHRLEIGQTPEEMVTIAEGNRFDSLKVVVKEFDDVDRSRANRRARAYGRMFDSDGHEDRFYEQSLDFILPLRLEQLYIRPSFGTRGAQRILDSVAMQSVRTLTLVVDVESKPVWRCLEKRHAPSLQNLDSNVIPRPSVGTDLIRCKLFELEEKDLDSLREFLASANSLRFLLLHLEVDFIPHPSLARHLTQFTFFGDRVVLSKLLDFLSSTEALQVLSVRTDGESDDAIQSLRVVTLPLLTSFKIHQGFFDSRHFSPFVSRLIAMLRMPVLRRLELKFTYDSHARDRSLGTGIFNEYLPGACPVPHQRLIRLDCTRLKLEQVKEMASRCLANMGDIQIKFKRCPGWEEGTFGLDELESARLYRDEDSDSD